MAAGVKRTMKDVRISSRALSALSAEVERGFEQRLLRFLTDQVSGFTPEPSAIWKGFLGSARALGLTTEQEAVFYVYGCYVLGDDIVLHDRSYFEDIAAIDDIDHRLVLIEERVLAYALAKEMGSGR